MDTLVRLTLLRNLKKSDLSLGHEWPSSARPSSLNLVNSTRVGRADQRRDPDIRKWLELATQ